MRPKYVTRCIIIVIIMLSLVCPSRSWSECSLLHVYIQLTVVVVVITDDDDQKMVGREPSIPLTLTTKKQDNVVVV